MEYEIFVINHPRPTTNFRYRPAISTTNHVVKFQLNEIRIMKTNQLQITAKKFQSIGTFQKLRFLAQFRIFHTSEHSLTISHSICISSHAHIDSCALHKFHEALLETIFRMEIRTRLLNRGCACYFNYLYACVFSVCSILLGAIIPSSYIFMSHVNFRTMKEF